MADELPSFEGIDVTGSRAKITNSGDGLSESMNIAGTVIHVGERGYAVLEWECRDVQHPFANKRDVEEGLVRTHVLRAETALILDAKLIREAVEKQKKINADKREADRKTAAEARGEFQLTVVD